MPFRKIPKKFEKIKNLKKENQNGYFSFISI